MNNKLRPDNSWSTWKWSSTLNKFRREAGYIDDSGVEHTINVQSTDATTKKVVKYTVPECDTIDWPKVKPVSE